MAAIVLAIRPMMMTMILMMIMVIVFWVVMTAAKCVFLHPQRKNCLINVVLDVSLRQISLNILNANLVSTYLTTDMPDILCNISCCSIF